MFTNGVRKLVYDTSSDILKGKGRTHLHRFPFRESTVEMSGDQGEDVLSGNLATEVGPYVENVAIVRYKESTIVI